MSETMLTDSRYYEEIADALREKLHDPDRKFKPSEMASAILELNTEVSASGTKDINTNGIHNITEFQNVNVQVPASDVVFGIKEITANGEYDVTKYAMVKVMAPTHPVSGMLVIDYNADNIDVAQYEKVSTRIPPEITSSGSKEITENGTHTVIGLAQVHVNVPFENSEPTGTIEFTENTDSPIDVSHIKEALVHVPASNVDSGTLEITTLGAHDVTGFASVDVNIPASAVDHGRKSIITGGLHDVVGYSQVYVDIPKYEVDGMYTVNANGVYDVSKYQKVEINITAHSVTSGTKEITENGSSIDVAEFRTVNVNVPASMVDAGTKQISVNGTHDVVGVATVEVNVPQHEPHGELRITENGEYDISNYSSVVIDVQPIRPVLNPDEYGDNND